MLEEFLWIFVVLFRQAVFAKLIYELQDIQSSNGQNITGPDHLLLDRIIKCDFQCIWFKKIPEQSIKIV